MRFLFFFLFYLVPSLHQQVFSIENNGLIYEVLDKNRVNATFISSTKIGFGSSDNILKVYDVEGNMYGLSIQRILFLIHRQLLMEEKL